jgi:hypothetical protein
MIVAQSKSDSASRNATERASVGNEADLRAPGRAAFVRGARPIPQLRATRDPCDGSLQGRAAQLG